MYSPVFIPLCLSGNESASSNEFIPLSELLMRPHTEEKQSHKVRRSSDVKSKQDRSGGWGRFTQTLSNTVFNIKKLKTSIWLYLYPVVASDVSSDDEPLIKLKKKAATAERPERKVSKSTRSTGTNEKKAGTLSTTCQQLYSSCVV